MRVKMGVPETRRSRFVLNSEHLLDSLCMALMDKLLFEGYDDDENERPEDDEN